MFGRCILKGTKTVEKAIVNVVLITIVFQNVTNRTKMETKINCHKRTMGKSVPEQKRAICRKGDGRKIDESDWSG